MIAPLFPRETNGIKKISIPSSWFLFFCLVCITLTFAEIVIVNRKNGIFTNGFLSTPVSGIFEVTVLLFSILTSNLLATSFIFIPMAMLATRIGAARSFPMALSGFIALSPVIMTDLITFQLVQYLGDQINYHLLTQIAGGSFATMLSHVSANHWLLLASGLMGSFAAVYCAAVIWAKYVRMSGHHLRQRVFIICAGGFLIGTLLIVGFASVSSERVDNGLRRFPAARALQLVLHFSTDFDRDGYSAFSRPSDPSGMDPTRYPYAADIPGNGIDENGLLGDLPGLSAIPDSDAVEIPQFRRHPVFVLLVLESFRNDVLFTKVKDKEVTPNLNRLASQGVYTQWGFSHNGYTVGSLNAIFGGTVTTNAETTLVDDFNSNGYVTACFSAANESFGNIDATTGLNRVDHFYDARQDIDRRCAPYTAKGSLTVPAEVVLERVQEFCTRRESGNQPLFLYVNFQDLHYPYHHYAVTPTINPEPLPRPRISPENRDRLKATYLNTAAYMDENVGKLVSLLETHFHDQVALVVSADHGESLFDDQFLGHGHHLSDTQTRIPFIAYGFPAILEEPMGQGEIRKMIRTGLMVDGNQQSHPVKMTKPEKRVFQYLGNLKRPHQIGWAYMLDRLTLDLRGPRWKKDSGTTSWQRLVDGNTPEDLSALVHYWETLQLQEFGLLR